MAVDSDTGEPSLPKGWHEPRWDGSLPGRRAWAKAIILAGRSGKHGYGLKTINKKDPASTQDANQANLASLCHATVTANVRADAIPERHAAMTRATKNATTTRDHDGPTVSPPPYTPATPHPPGGAWNTHTHRTPTPAPLGSNLTSNLRKNDDRYDGTTVSTKICYHEYTRRDAARDPNTRTET